MPYNSRYPPSGGNYRSSPRDYRNDRDARSRNRPSPRETYRPSSYGGRNGHDSRSFRDGAPPPHSTYPGPPGVDNYRPPQSDFTFHVDKPAGIQEADTYRPQSNRKARSNRREARSPHRDSRPAKRSRGAHDRPARNGRENGPSKGSGGRPWRPFIAAERELLKADHNTGSEVAYYDTSGGVTFRPLDELSDSDEAEMDISGDEAETSNEPSSKRPRLSVEQSASDNNTPKWSNPDPYTALPPETAPQTKKKDVVQMIRKARIQTNETRAPLPSEAADFIALDFDSDSSENEDSEQEESAKVASPSTVSSASVGSPGRQPTRNGAASTKPTRTPVLYPDPSPSALGSRKRTHDDEIKLPHTRLKKATKVPAGGGIVSEWLPVPELVPTPWVKADHSRSANMAVW